MSWKDLSMADRAEYIKAGVQNGITDLSHIKKSYNEYENDKLETSNSTEKNLLNKAIGNTFKKIPEAIRGVEQEVNKYADEFKNTFGISLRDAAGIIPYIGDALDIKDISEDITNKKYGEAALGAGLLLLPNAIEKPLKYAAKGLREALRYANDFSISLPLTINAIAKKRYVPFMSKAKKQEYLDELDFRIRSEVGPFTREIVNNNVRVRNNNNNGIKEFTPDFLQKFASSSMNTSPYPFFPKVEFKQVIPGAYGLYYPSENIIKLRTRDFLGNHRLRKADKILGTAAHEYGHFWSKQYPRVEDLRKDYGPNMNHPDINIFRPIFKHKPGKWESRPNEVISEIFKEKWNTKSPDIIGPNSPNLEYIAKSLSKRFNINRKEAKKMILEMGDKGYKYGGKLN